MAAGAAGLSAPAIGVAASLTGGGAARAATGATRKVTIYAEALPGGLYGYGLAPGQATVPGPILQMWEGDTLEITLVNTTNQRLSIHPHGVDYSTDSDGSPLNDSFNDPGETRTYVWRSREMVAAEGRRFMPGSAGYWHYHDHAMGTDHGTGGLAKGLYGALIVRRRGDILPEKQFTVVFNDMMINNRMAPTPRCSRPTSASGSSGSPSGTAARSTPSTCTPTAGRTTAPGCSRARPIPARSSTTRTSIRGAR
jgi:FtsP/CotA-like multicopper oxidase with cupredoxin domain